MNKKKTFIVKSKHSFLCPVGRRFAIYLLIVLITVVIAADFPGIKLKTYTNSVGMEFVLVPAGSFNMGLSTGYSSPCMNERPQHMVTISRPFYICRYEVTQEQWDAVMAENPSKFKGSKNPVERVSWQDAQEFIQKLNESERTQSYRLPTEAEWEYACRAGTGTPYFFGDSADQLPNYAWCHKNSDHTTHPVGQLQPNAWGIYDTLGNVWEWCQDVYDRDYYQYSPAIDPQGPPSGSRNVLRGGSWHSINPYRFRCCYRFCFFYDGRLPNIGLRLVKTIE